SEICDLRSAICDLRSEMREAPARSASLTLLTKSNNFAALPILWSTPTHFKLYVACGGTHHEIPTPTSPCASPNLLSDSTLACANQFCSRRLQEATNRSSRCPKRAGYTHRIAQSRA